MKQYDTLAAAMEAGARWAFVKGWGAYAVDEHGNLYGQSGRRRSLYADRRGYVRVVLSKGAEQATRYLHRIMWEAFYGELPDGLEVHHIDHDASNNSLDNLGACTHRGNIAASELAGRRFDLGAVARSNSCPVVNDEGREFPSLVAAAEWCCGKRSGAANILRAMRSGRRSYGFLWQRA